ncbi:MAG TPA: ATP-binding cassette domain-containing protein [Polyangiaceae bacterium]|nr:ATP-binding cassette domain-containing protein [Polyangiaceae bacterium]
MVVTSVISVLWSILDRKGRATFSLLVGMLFVSGIFELGGMMAIFGFISGLNAHHESGERHGHVAKFVRLVVAGPIDAVTYVTIGGGAVVAFMIIKNVQGMLAQFLMNRFLMKRNLVLSKELLEGYLAAPYELLQPRAVVGIQKRIKEIYSVFSTNFTCAAQVLSDGLTLSMVVALLIYVNPTLTLVAALIFGGIGSLIYWVLQSTLTKMGRDAHDAKTNTSKFLEQAFGGIVETRLRDLRSYFVRHYVRALSRSTVLKRRKLALERLPRSTNEVLLTVMIVGSVLYLSLVGQGMNEALPTLAIFGFAGLRMTGSMSRVNNNLQKLRQGHERMMGLSKTLRTVGASFSDPAAATFIGKYTDRELALPAGDSKRLSQRIALSGVSFRYPQTKKTVLSDVTLEIAKGQFVAICGPSGGGKSTLLKVLMGLLNPTSGEVSCDDWNVFHHIRAWHKNIGYVGQNLFITDDSVRLNVAVGHAEREIDDQKVRRALELASAWGFVEQLSEGMNTPLLSGDVLSGGQRQRIVIARALYDDPDILIFDEATAALDNQTEREVTQAIQALSGRKTVIFVAHRLTTIVSADVIFFMQKGRLVASGTYDQLMEQCAPFRSMAGAGQSKKKAQQQ